MTNPLSKYRKKRNFSLTPEPSGVSKSTGKSLRFVIQKHAARRLHYDFRLELDATLKVGLCPKGRVSILAKNGWRSMWKIIHWSTRDEAARPSAEFNVTEELPNSVTQRRRKRPAAATQDKETAHHKRLVKITRQKTVPAVAIKAALPKTLKPQLATLIKSPPEDGDWSYEIKFDGYRLLARVSGSSVRLFTRNGNDWTSKLPVLASAIKGLNLKSPWLDGEIVVMNEDGRDDFQELQNAFEKERTSHIQYFLFDLPYFAGYDLRQAPLSERRLLLRQILKGSEGGPLHFSEDLPGAGQQILTEACRLGLEGVIGKRKDSTYVSARSQSWVKLKCQQRQEFVVVGFTDPQGSREKFGALMLGVYGADGTLRYAGRVGTGFDSRLLRSVHARLKGLEIKTPAFANPPRGRMARGAHWVKPVAVAEVSFTQWTEGGTVRHAVFHGLRADKPAAAIARERPAALKLASAGKSALRRLPKPEIRPADGDMVGKIRITHPDRVIEKKRKLTKIDLARYYESVQEWILPHLKARPVALLRGPEGIDNELFFQKHIQRLTIPGVQILDPKVDPGHESLMVIGSLEALIGATQMGAIEFHTWNATTKAIERPDRLVLDLDPDTSLSWQTVVETATLTKALLDELDLESFVKTSGGKGLHIVLALARRHSWEEVLAFSQAISRHLAATIPKRFSAKMGPQNRVKKVFVDYLRNRRGASTVAAYSARARISLPVSVPIAWEELREIAGADYWNIATLPKRLQELRRDPWADYARKAHTLTSKMKKSLGLIS